MNATKYAPKHVIADLLQRLRTESASSVVELASRVALQYPADGVPENISGLALLQAEQPDDAIPHFEESVRRQPDYADAWHNLAKSNAECKSLEVAWEQLKTALSLTPDRIPYQLTKVRLLLQRFEPEQALALATEILKREPGNVNAKRYQAEALFDLKRSLDAVQCLQSLSPKEPIDVLKIARSWSAMSLHHRVVPLVESVSEYLRSPENRLQAASLLCEAGDTGAALALLEPMRHGSSSRADVLFNFGHALSEAGRDGEATDVFALLLKECPNHDYGLYELSGLINDPEDAGVWLSFGERETNSREPLWFYGLARLALRLGEPERALGHLRIANGIQERRLAWNEQLNQRQCEAIKQLYDQMLVGRSSMSDENDSSPSPVFITGLPRCGSTKLAWELTKDQRFFSGGEIGLADQCFQQALRQRATSAPAALRGFPDFYRNELRAMAPEAQFVIDKLLSNGLYMGPLKLLFPDASFVRSHREPVDHCLSIFGHPFRGMAYTQSVAGIVGQMRLEAEQVNHWSVHANVHLANVSAEALRSDPAGLCKSMLSQLGIPVTDMVGVGSEGRGSFNTLSSKQIKNSENSSASRSGWRSIYPYLNDTEKKALDGIISS